MILTDLPPAQWPPFATREAVPGFVEVMCPACTHWRAAFVLQSSDGTTWTCDAERSTAALAIMAQPAADTLVIAVLDYLQLFTGAELAAAMASTDPRMRVATAYTLGAPTINLANPQVIGGLQLMQSLGILAPARAAAIGANQPPPAS